MFLRIILMMGLMVGMAHATARVSSYAAMLALTNVADGAHCQIIGSSPVSEFAYSGPASQWSLFSVTNLTPTNTPTATATVTATVTPTPTATLTSAQIVQNYTVNIQQAANDLKNFRNAYDRMKNFQGTRCKVLVIGDSTEAGAGAPIPTGDGLTGAATLASPYDLAWIMTNHGLSAYNSSRMANNGYGNGYDPRMVENSGWSYGGPSCLGGNISGNSASTQTATFSPSNNVDTFQIIYPTTSSATSIVAEIDSGTPVTINQYSASSALASASVSATSGVHTLSLKLPSLPGSCFWSAILAYNNTNPFIEVLNAGLGGGQTSNFISNTSVWDALPEIEYIAPNLTIIDLYINDAANSVPVTTYQANLQTIITACQLSGDVILITGNPNNSSTVNATYPSYLAAMISLAQTNNCLFFDTQQRFYSWAQANNLGWMYDQYHPNLLGYFEKAEALFYSLTQFIY